MNQRDSTDFNKRVGAKLQRIRKAAGLSQADLATQLEARGLPFQQPTILKVEKGSRPLKLEEAYAIAQILRVNVASLSQHIDNETAEWAVAQLERCNLLIAQTERGIQEARKRAQLDEQAAYAFLERVTVAKREAEQQLGQAGGFQ